MGAAFTFGSPLDVPPATPLPEKSASSMTFLLRSTFGMMSGISTGAVSTWNPLGGGGAATASGGGGGGGSFLGGGGSSFFISTNSTFSSFGFSASIVACAVAYTAPARRTVWRMTLVTVPAVLRCFLAFDSSRLFSMGPRTRAAVSHGSRANAEEAVGRAVDRAARSLDPVHDLRMFRRLGFH
jgi:hypothetical protein